jgi:hypothetical protein
VLLAPLRKKVFSEAEWTMRGRGEAAVEEGMEENEG